MSESNGTTPMKTQDEHTSADYYFDSYSHFGIHEEMLKDSVRTRTYRDSIRNNPHLFRDKIVLDIGCGTAILSMFCIQAGAKHVYAIDMSAIAEQAKQIVADNGMADQITVIRAKVEELELPVAQVDIIVSEWMGYFLFYESMLDTVLFARDKWLRPGGLLFPDKASLHIMAIEDGDYKQDKIEFWHSVYGFDMSAIRDLAIQEPLVDTVEASQICSSSTLLLEVDISKMRSPAQSGKSSSNFSAPFTVSAIRNDHVHALVAYFDIDFGASHKQIGFSTSPKARATHWKQAVFYLEDTIMICKGEKLQGTISCLSNSSNPRDLDIEITYDFSGEHGTASGTQTYRMR